MKILLVSWLAFLTVIAACWGVSSIPAGYLEPDLPGKHRIVVSREYPTYYAWANSPWFRVTDEYEFPVYILIDQTGYGCVAPPEIWALNPTYAACPTNWRAPR